ncbi:COPII subunit, partial [Ceratobasidium sp. 392]
MAEQQQLPPGWISQWDETHQRPLFIQTETGHTQWELPAFDQQQYHQDSAAQGQPGPPTHSKRRQYAAGQSQAYSGAAEMPPMQPQAYADPTAGAQHAPAFFTPGLEQTQQQPAYYGQDAGYGGPAPAQPPYGQPQPAYGHQVNQMADQFAQMGMGGQKGYGIHTTNIIGTFLDPNELTNPPPEIRLPPNAAIAPSPLSNADYSYMRSTINAIPTTNALLAKTKLPLALIITPFRSVREMDHDQE